MPTHQALVTHSTAEGVFSSIEARTTPTPNEGEVLIRTHYAGVNFKDCLSVLGAAKIISSFPRIAGIEAVGEVIESRSEGFAPGSLVLIHGFQTGIDFDGGFSEMLCAPAARVQALPEGLSSLQAAIIGVPGFTSAMALDRFQALGLNPETGLIAISGAGGAVGRLAINIFSQAGYKTAALTRNLAMEPALKKLGAVEVIDTTVATTSTRPIEKPRFAAAVDNVGGPVLSWLLRSLDDKGLLASVGNASGNQFDGSVLPFIMRRVQMFGVVANASWSERLKLWSKLASEWKPDFEALADDIHLIALDQLLDHARQQLSGTTSGRTIIRFEAAQ